MSKSIPLYYGQIVARIAIKLSNLTPLKKQSMLLESDMSQEDIICDLSADAGRIFDKLEDLSGEHFVDWIGALEHYADEISSFVMYDKLPTNVDMITMASNSIEACRANNLQ